MIAAVAHNEERQDRIILLGLVPENVQRLLTGEPIRISAETHPGFPEDLRVLIVFADDERTIFEALRPSFSEQTKIIAMPDDEGTPS